MSAVEDLRVIVDAATDLSWHVAEELSRRDVLYLVLKDGWSALFDMIGTRELLSPEMRDQFRHSFASLAGPGGEEGLEPGWLWRPGTPWEPFARAALAALASLQGPQRCARVRSLTFGNPVIADLIWAADVGVLANGYLLQVITALGSRRRRENARADAEERIQAAHARDIEDLVDTRIQIRRLLLEGMASGQVTLRPEDINDLLLDKITGAADRLADRDLTFEQLELPSGGR